MRASLAAALALVGTLSGASAQADQLDVWRDRSVARISAALKYPADAGRRREAQAAVVRFNVDRSGRIADVAIEKTSGVDEMDKAALAAVKDADPLPPPPLPDKIETLAVKVPIKFSPTSGRSLERAKRAIGSICTGC